MRRSEKGRIKIRWDAKDAWNRVRRGDGVGTAGIRKAAWGQTMRSKEETAEMAETDWKEKCL